MDECLACLKFQRMDTEGLWDLEETLHVTTSALLESCTNCLPLNVGGMNLKSVEMVQCWPHICEGHLFVYFYSIKNNITSVSIRAVTCSGLKMAKLP